MKFRIYLHSVPAGTIVSYSGFYTQRFKVYPYWLQMSKYLTIQHVKNGLRFARQPSCEQKYDSKYLEKLPILGFIVSNWSMQNISQFSIWYVLGQLFLKIEWFGFISMINKTSRATLTKEFSDVFWFSSSKSTTKPRYSCYMVLLCAIHLNRKLPIDR